MIENYLKTSVMVIGGVAVIVVIYKTCKNINKIGYVAAGVLIGIPIGIAISRMMPLSAITHYKQINTLKNVRNLYKIASRRFMSSSGFLKFMRIFAEFM